MKTSELIDADIECMREYSARLIEFATQLQDEFASSSSQRGYRSNLRPIDISHLIRPDLICSIYSLLDFRLRSLCEHHERKASNVLKFEAFKRGDRSRTSDLDRYRRYFQNEVGIDLKPLRAIFDQLDLLRRIRNSYIHSGGHMDEKAVKLVSNIHGVSVHYTLLVVNDEYIFESLENTQSYLHAIAQA